MNFSKIKSFFASYKIIILTLIAFITISLITIVIYIKNSNPKIIEQEQKKLIPMLKKQENNFIYSVPNEIGQLFPNTEMRSYSLYSDSQEFLVQKPLISTFFEELVDEKKWNNFDDDQKKEIIHYNLHLIPRKFDFHLIEKVKTSDEDLNSLIGTNDGFNNSQNKKAKTFTFVLRQDAKFENGTPINAKTIQTTIQKFIDLFGDFKDDILGLSDNGIERVENEPYAFKLNFSTPKSLFEVIKNINRIILIEETEYQKSISNDGQIKYGTKAHPFISYGPYKVKEGYNDQRWIFSKNDLYFGRENNLPYDEVQILIENNSGNSFKEEELFENNKLHFYAREPNIISSNFLNKFKKDLFCKPDRYSLIIIFSSNPRVEDINLRKALFYAIDRKKIKETNPFLFPSLDLMSDIYKTNDSIFTFNETEPHKNNIIQMFEEDLKNYSQQNGNKYPNRPTLEDEIALLKNNFGYNENLSRFFLSKYKKNNQQPIELTLANRDGTFSDENLIRKIKEQIEETFTIEDMPQMRLQYRLNDSTADINISVSGSKPSCLISAKEQQIRQSGNSKILTFSLTKDELKKIPELEKRVYSSLFNIPLAQLKQVRFLFDAKNNFIKYFNFFGFRTKPYDFVGDYQ